MKIRSRKSFGRLSEFFARDRKSKSENQSHLIWILFSNFTKQLQGDTTDGASGETIAMAIQELEDVHSVTLLRNTNPSYSQRTSATIVPRTSPLSILVHIDGAASLEVVMQNINLLLEDAKARRKASEKPAMHWKFNTYIRTQNYNSSRSRKISSSCVVSIAIEPGLDQDEDVDAWYRQEHLDMQAANAFFVRSNRFERIIGDAATFESSPTVPKFLALHEYTSLKDLLDHSIHVGPVVEETAWSKRVLDNVRWVERTSWTVEFLE